MFKIFTKYTKQYKKYALLSPLCVLIETIIELILPLLIAKLIDDGVSVGNMSIILKIGGIMAILSIISLIFGILCGRYAAIASTGFAKNLRSSLFGKCQDFSFNNVDKFSTGSLVTRMTTDVDNLKSSFQMCIRIVFRAPAIFIFALIMSIYLNPQLSLIFLISVPIVLIGMTLIIAISYPKLKKLFAETDEMNNKVQENLVGIRVVKTFVREDHEIEKFKKVTTRLKQLQTNAEKIMILDSPLMQLTMYGTMIAIVWFGGNMALSGSMTTGTLMSFISYSTQILFALMMIAYVFISLVMSKVSASRINEVLNEEIDITNDHANTELQILNGDIDFDNVSFSYKGKESANLVLSDINLHINSGETIGIIGGTGSGKTSLVQLIPRLYDTNYGEVKVAGNNVKEYDIKTLRDSVSMILQKNVLFSGTIKDNLKWGNENATDEEIIDACKLAQADSFINNFPDKYETELGQGGVNVSGGQKQRLCIARALLKSPKILILDDSTSAVDTTTDLKIRQNLKNSRKNITVLIIAQRINSVKDADKIIVINDGKITGFGTHDELLKTNEIYQEVYQSQSKVVE